MTTDSVQDSTDRTATDQELLSRLYKPWRKEALGEFPFKLIFVVFGVAAPIMLVGLPVAALAIVHLSDCCTNQSMASFLTFWGGLFGGMLALFGTLIAAVFVISAFRIDKSAKAEARMAAEDAISDFILDHRRELLEKVDAWAHEVESRKNRTLKSIDTAKAAAESASKEAVAEVERVSREVVQKGRQMTEDVDQATRDLADEKAVAIERIEAEVGEVERAAAEAKAKFQTERPDESPPSDSQD